MLKIENHYYYPCGLWSDQEFPKLYKFIKSEYTESLLRDGKLRVGTLYQYRNQEKFGDHIGDKEEGRYTVFLEKEVIVGAMDEKQKLWLDGVISPNDKRHWVFENCAREFNAPNSFIYCLTKKCSKKFLKAKDFGNTCLRVTDVAKLILILRREIDKHYSISSFGWGECEYQDRNFNFDNDDWQHQHPALLKDKSYKYQNEVRLLFNCNQSPAVDYIDIQHEELKACFKKIFL